MSNATFLDEEPSWANACVGDNGNPGYVEYSKGFSTAANIFLKQILDSEDQYYHKVDALIYPICFNMRHSVELRLKGAIEEIIEIARIKGNQLNFDLKSSHDIGNIWLFFRTESEKIDRRYIPINNKLHDTISDIANIDPTRQTFRYPMDNENKKHLTDVGGLINCQVLSIKFSELETNFR